MVCKLSHCLFILCQNFSDLHCLQRKENEKKSEHFNTNVESKEKRSSTKERFFLQSYLFLWSHIWLENFYKLSKSKLFYINLIQLNYLKTATLINVIFALPNYFTKNFIVYCVSMYCVSF